jgi:hypothetical protein
MMAGCFFPFVPRLSISLSLPLSLISQNQLCSSWLEESYAVYLDEPAHETDGKKWDQFEANFKLTGKTATYDESM